MAKKSGRPAVREPIQVYLTAEERGELDRLANVHGISRAEVLRRGIRSFGLEGSDWPADLASGHDSYLADVYLRELGEDE
jgi:hypothetical protein